MNENIISSTQNTRVKRLLVLQQKSSERRRTGLFVVEGRRELSQCVASGMEVEEVFCCPQLSEDALPTHGGQTFEVTPAVYERIAYRGSTEGVVAVVKQHDRSLTDISLGDNPLLVVLESVEKPGNLGAVLRSADAAGATAVIVCDPLTDLYNPNLIRASLGAFFCIPVVTCSSEECIRFLKDNRIGILTAQLQDSNLYYATDMRGPVAIVMGTEADGLTQQWRRAATEHIRIPMLGRVDSLNVSVSAAILLYEAVRQRQGQY